MTNVAAALEAAGTAHRKAYAIYAEARKAYDAGGPVDAYVVAHAAHKAALDAYDAAEAAYLASPVATVKRPDLFGNVNDTYATEGELNGFRPEQAKLF